MLLIIHLIMLFSSLFVLFYFGFFNRLIIFRTPHFASLYHRTLHKGNQIVEGWSSLHDMENPSDKIWHTWYGMHVFMKRCSPHFIVLFLVFYYMRRLLIHTRRGVYNSIVCVCVCFWSCVVWINWLLWRSFY